MSIIQFLKNSYCDKYSARENV